MNKPAFRAVQKTTENLMKKTLALMLCFGLAVPLIANAEPNDKEEKERRKAEKRTEKIEKMIGKRGEREDRRAERDERRAENAETRIREQEAPRIVREAQPPPMAQPQQAQPQIAVQSAGAPEVNAEVRPRDFRHRRVERRGPRSHAWSIEEAHRYQLRDRHDRDWWRSRYNRFALFGGGYYYWDRGYWYPAYGYDSRYSSYRYDEPIYGYNYMEPRQVMVRVQRELRREGYYRGPIDGLIGPMTRAALARFQRDAGLRVTRRIDGPTLAALGVV